MTNSFQQLKAGWANNDLKSYQNYFASQGLEVPAIPQIIAEMQAWINDT